MSPRRATLLTYGSVGLLAALSAARLLEAGGVPWVVLLAVAVASALVVGPAAWLARDRLPEDRRETLGTVGIVLALLAFPVWLGGSLAFGIPLRRWLDVLLVGVAVGTALVVLAEYTVVPERLRGFGV
ncbi:hypothetical protein [Halorubrum halodurans]|uniref:Uncharacterized protein n=1 Tax=Halorubrum halodurans TaxID=1383851 RepID=A0A256IGR2_9EURY|nr:hypothetical protein [Halorubrum halodurans]OYR55476.1 hypothetical protein DJ70_11935 [Halorubrum halodurans]